MGETIESEDRVIVVTGSSSGLGAALIKDFAARGFGVCINYVVEEDAGRVTRVDPQTGTATPVADGLALRGLERSALGESTSIGFLSGVAVDNGTLFVSDYQGNRVYRIDR